MEIVHVGAETRQYPGVYLFSTPGRLTRPVINLKCNKQEFIGSMEQIYLEIACVPEDLNQKTTTHCEYSPTAMLSIIASLTPFSDFNQSPRNMYQCQVFPLPFPLFLISPFPLLPLSSLPFLSLYIYILFPFFPFSLSPFASPRLIRQFIPSKLPKRWRNKRWQHQQQHI